MEALKPEYAELIRAARAWYEAQLNRGVSFHPRREGAEREAYGVLLQAISALAESAGR